MNKKKKIKDKKDYVVTLVKVNKDFENEQYEDYIDPAYDKTLINKK